MKPECKKAKFEKVLVTKVCSFDVRAVSDFTQCPKTSGIDKKRCKIDQADSILLSRRER